MADQKHKRTSPGAVRLRIEALLDPNKTVLQVADEACSTRDYVFEIAKLNGVKLRPEPRENQINGVWNDKTVEALRKMWLEDGLSAGQIARVLGFTRNAVISKINRKGWMGRREVGKPATPRKTKPSVSRAPTPKFSAEYVPPPPSEYDVPRKRLVDLAEQDCRFPIDLPKSGYGFCALEKIPGSRYCLEHARRCTPGVFESTGRKPQIPANDREKVEA